MCVCVRVCLCAAPQRLNWLSADQGATSWQVPSTHPPSGPGMGPARSMTCRRHHGPQPPLGAVSPIDKDSAPRVLSAQAGVCRQDSHGRVLGGPSLLTRAQCNARPQTPARPWGIRRSATETHRHSQPLSKRANLLRVQGKLHPPRMEDSTNQCRPECNT